MADRGLASRKESDRLIEDGLVFVDNTKAVLGMRVREDADIRIGGIAKEYIYLLYYKPKGIVTVGAQEGERDIRMVLKREDIFPIGRLDKDSEGLIILTNDGRLTKKLLDPDAHMEKEYRVVLDQPVTHMLLKRIQNGVTIGKGEKTKPALVRKVDSHTIDIVLTEGKNRQIRRMVAGFGYTVTDLIRFRIGHLMIDDLKPGQKREISAEEIATFFKK